MSLARMTYPYGDVYSLALASRMLRSSGVNLMRYGLVLGMTGLLVATKMPPKRSQVQRSIRHRTYVHRY